LIHNPSYLERNNNSSIWAARDVLANSYLCSADNYFSANPFEAEVSDAYYAAEYAEGETAEWCMEEDTEGYISSVTVGGSHAWYMLGHTFWSAEYSKEFLRILGEEYDLPQTADKLWESIFMEHLDTLKMRIRKYEPEVIHEFDTLDELREFDSSYVDDTRSAIVRSVARELGVTQREIVGAAPLKGSTTEAEGFTFLCAGKRYAYGYESGELTMVGE
jgi:CTP:phosphocholine cytidylyltransferase-like protein